MKVTILGCGSSGGVPLTTGEWGVCDPHNPKNRRRRCSLLIQEESENYLVDTSPDLRAQLLDHPVSHIDGVLYTHAHADHILGLDDLRCFSFKQQHPIPLYGHPDTLEQLKKVFSYLFGSSNKLYVPFGEGVLFTENPFNLKGKPVIPFMQDHVTMTSWGFRFGNMAYSTDFKYIPQASLALLKDLDIWIIECLRFEEHTTHSHFDNTMAYIKQVNPRRAILTHMNHMADYKVLLEQCPEGVEPAYDGMVLEARWQGVL